MPEAAIQQPNGLIRTSRMMEEERAERAEKEAKVIITEMDAIRESILTSILKLADLSHRLRTHALRHRGDMTSGYLAYSSAYARICGALNQGLRRTASVGRALESNKVNLEETRQREAREEEQRKIRAQNREIEKLSLPSADDFDTVYGEVE